MTHVLRLMNSQMKLGGTCCFSALFLMASAVTAVAEDFEYTVESDNTVTINGYTGDSDTVVIPNMIDGKPVTRIGGAAFIYRHNLMSVSIPPSVVDIGESAFLGCQKLAGITIPDNVTRIADSTFDNCSGLISVTIPANVTNIGDHAFFACSSLTNVVIPHLVTGIGVSAFSGCDNLVRVTIGNSVVSIGEEAFASSASITGVTIPKSVITIGVRAFSGCSGLATIDVDATNPSFSSIKGVLYDKSQTKLIQCPAGKLGSVDIPSGVTSIGESAFEFCVGLTSIVIPSSVTHIGEGAFAGCEGLTSIAIPSSVTSIGDYAFVLCDRLTKVDIPSSVTSIGLDAFGNCGSLRDIMVGELNSVYSSLDGVLFNKSQTILCQYPAGRTGAYTIPAIVNVIGEKAFDTCRNLTGVTIPSNITSIRDYAFQACSGLTNVVIPGTVASIGQNVFVWCHGLTSVTISEGITSIGGWAFYDCIMLTSVTIPSSVTSIGHDAFGYCRKLSNVVIGKGVTNIVDYAFQGCSSLSRIAISSSVTMIGTWAFQDCKALTSVVFTGNAPSVGPRVFQDAVNVTVYYLPGTTGWGAMFSERPTAPWDLSVVATFDAEGGTATPASKNIKFNANYGSLPAAMRSGYAFAGWWTDVGGTGTQVTETTLVTEASNHALHAKWIANMYTVTFDPEGGEVIPASKSVTYGLVYGPLPIPVCAEYTFAGWWTGSGGTGAQVTENTTVSITDLQTLFAKWEKRFPTEIATPIGVVFAISLPDVFTNQTKVTVKGLPSGLKYNTATKTIEGVPTKAGTYDVEISAAGVDAQKVTLTVAALPPWAQGTFNGYVQGGGLASMTVSAAGKVSGKISLAGTNYTFSSASYSRSDADGSTFWVKAQAKSGGTVQPLELSVSRPILAAVWAGFPVLGDLSVAESEDGWLRGGQGSGPALFMWRDVWKDAAETLSLFTGYYTATLPGNEAVGSGYLTLTVDKAGKVKTAGKLADGTPVSLSGTLIHGGLGVFAPLYTVPVAYKGGCFFGLAEFVKPYDGQSLHGEVYLRPSGDEPFLWESRNPQATGEYGKGFSRQLGITGGWYSKTENLYDYYEGRNLFVGIDPDARPPELAVGSTRYGSICWDPSGVVLSPVLKSSVMTGLTAPPAGKPTDPENDGTWSYSATNSVGLKLALTRPTGVFKGSFNAWFDYPVKKHVSKPLAFEGVLTPVREDPSDGVAGRGFFLWPDKSLSPAYAFKWSYDFKILLTD